MELVRKQAELLLAAEQVLTVKGKKRTGRQGMDAGSLNAEMKKLESGKVSDYENYKAGKITRETFIERKKASDIKRQELAAVLAELEEQGIVEDGSKRRYGEVFGIKDFLHLEEYDKTVMASLIASAKVMGEGRLEVTWKHQDVYEKILSEIHG